MENDKNTLDPLKESQGHEPSGDHGNDMVKIFVNDEAILIHRGSQTVAQIKLAGKVSSTDILYEMPHYEIALKDTDRFTIHGGERFKSSAPSGGSS